MKLGNLYTIDFTHPYVTDYLIDFVLDGRYWEVINSEEILNGSVKAQVTVHPRGEVYDLTFRFSGEVESVCDRCLAPMLLSVDDEVKITVSLGEGMDDSDDQILVLDRKEPKYDFAWMMYEMIALGLPMQRVHEEGECDPKMLGYILGRVEDKEEPMRDPRWDALRAQIEKGSNNKLK